MTSSWDYERALQELWRRSSYERGLISDPFGDVTRAELGLERMRTLLGELDNPHTAVPAVHVAGSKGKGSTGAFIAAAATRAGHRVGFYSSPHLHRFPERIAIDGRPIADSSFAAEAQAVAEAARCMEALKPESGRVTTFEMVTAMALNGFARQACDLAVIEVGLGGRYDATNVLLPIASVITRIDLEHTAVLGPTYADIAWQKAGILRQGVPALSAPQEPEAAAAIIRVAREVGSPLQIGGQDWTWGGTWRAFQAIGPWGNWTDLSIGIPGPHQIENACTALAALYEIDKAGIRVSEQAIRTGLATARWPGRFERVFSSGRDVIFDGAHTPAAAVALVNAWREDRGAALATVVLGMAADKNFGAFLAALRPLINRLIVTRADSPRAADPVEIANAAGALGIPHEVRPTVASAVEVARSSDLGHLLITGSLFVVAEGREALGLAQPDRVWLALNKAGGGSLGNDERR
jgi:dihydrofolate synthase / folylpolyglutamate synthase